jgi:hypothetical protein
MPQVLIAHINPSLKVPVSDNEFQEDVSYLFGPYMIVQSRSFVMGADSVNFVIYYGDVTKKDDVITSFNPIKQQNLTLSGQVVDDWGTDDSEILYAVAGIVGTNVDQIIIANIDMLFV